MGQIYHYSCKLHFKIKEKRRKIVQYERNFSFFGMQFDRRNDVMETSQSMYLKTVRKKFDI